MEGACLRRVSRGAGFEEVFPIGLPGGGGPVAGPGGAGLGVRYRLWVTGLGRSNLRGPGEAGGLAAYPGSGVSPTGAESEGQRLLKLVREELGELEIENPGTRP